MGKQEDDRTSILVLTYRSLFLGPVNAFSQIGQGFSENHVFMLEILPYLLFVCFDHGGLNL
jgi:hypothetical protein